MAGEIFQDAFEVKQLVEPFTSSAAIYSRRPFSRSKVVVTDGVRFVVGIVSTLLLGSQPFMMPARQTKCVHGGIYSGQLGMCPGIFRPARDVSRHIQAS